MPSILTVGFWAHALWPVMVAAGAAQNPSPAATQATLQYDPPSGDAPTTAMRALPQPMRHVFVGSFLHEGPKSLGPVVGVVQDADFDNMIIRPGDHVRVSCAPPCQAKVGDSLYAFVKPTPIKHPITHEIMGNLTEASGILMVKRVKADGVWAQVVSSVMEIERGQGVAQVVTPLYQNIVPKNPDVTLRGHVVAISRNLLLGREERMLFVDVGRKHGVQQGDVLTVRGRRDTVRPPLPKKAHVEDVAQIVIVAVGEQVSTAVVAEGLWEIALGDAIIASP